jgi:hypothetical protein
MLQFRHFRITGDRGFEKVASLQANQRESGILPPIASFEMQRKLGLNPRNRDMLANDFFGQSI